MRIRSLSVKPNTPPHIAAARFMSFIGLSIAQRTDITFFTEGEARNPVNAGAQTGIPAVERACTNLAEFALAFLSKMAISPYSIGRSSPFPCPFTSILPSTSSFIFAAT